MELNYRLPENLYNRLKSIINEDIVYCIHPDINLEGEYTDSFYVGATKSVVFRFDGANERFYKIADCEKAQVRSQVNNGLFTLTIKGEECIVARFTMKHNTHFASFARGVKCFIDGKTDKVVTNAEPEKECEICGRMLNKAGRCPKCNRTSRGINRLLSVCKPHKKMLFVIFSVMLGVTAFSLGQQFVIRWFVDNHLALGKGNIGDIAIFISLYLMIVVAGIVGSLIRTYLCSKLGMKIAQNLRGRLTSHLQELSLSFTQKRGAGEIIERIFNDTHSVRMFFMNSFCNVFSQAVTLIALVVLMFILNWKLALAALVFVPLILIFSRTFWPYIRKIFRHMRKKGDVINNQLQDVLSGIRIVKSYGRESFEIERFNALNNEYAAIQAKNEKFFATFFPLLSLLLSLGTYIIVYLGGLDVLSGSMTVGGLMQFVAYAGMLLGPLNTMSFLPRQLIGMTTSLDRIYDVLDEESEVPEADNPIKRKIDGDISIKNVVFGYNSYDPVLDGISLEVKKGEMIGLVGASGTGKSTLINLLMRLYDVDEGEILVDGINIKQYDIKDYHSQIGVVLQETFLFAGTVAENIAFSKPDASLSEIIMAAKAANAHEFICRLPDGYNTYIGEKGFILSGGEKQRIAIARAIIGDPKILILDEATSALDTENEYQIQQALERLRKGRTTFAIAHRLSTLRCADRLVVIDNNTIAEAGTHNELLKKKGIYYDLVMSQLEMSGRKVSKIKSFDI